MKKINIIPQIVFEILKFKKFCNLICGEHYNLRQIFPRHQFSQNHIASYGASFKTQKVMLPSLKCQNSTFDPNLSHLAII